MTEYIEREEAIDTVLDAYFNTPKVDLKGELFYRGLLKMPAADVAPVKHGQWIDNGANGYKWAFVCSLCRYVDGHPFNNRHNFCPNCGAKMDGGDNNDA